MKKELRVLMVEDSEEVALLITRALSKLPYDVTFERVDTAQAMADALDANEWDVVLSDYGMPKFDGLLALRMVRDRLLDTPFILVSGTIGEEVAVTAMKAGAHDYVMKGNLTRLGPAIERELREAEIRQEHALSQQAIREIDERNRAIVTTAADGIITFDEHGVIESFNPAAERIFGYPAGEAVGENLATLLPSRSHDRRADNRLGGVELPGAEAFGTIVETEGLRKDGSQIPVEIAISKVRFGDRGLFTGIVHDITERRTAQEQIRRQFEKMNALRAIDVAITGSFDVRVTMGIVLDQVATLLGVDAADVLLVDDVAGDLRCAAARGFYSNAVRQSRLRMGEGLAGRAAMERCMVEVRDLSENGEFTRGEMLAHERFVTYYAIPLVAKGKMHGVLEVFHRSLLDVDADWLTYLETLAGQAAIALDSTLTFEELQRRNAELLVAYDLTIEGWARALDLRDKETEGHTRRVTELTVRLTQKMGFSDAEVAHARRGALLHDIGKLGVPDSILLKPGPLTDEEWVVMRKHPGYAHDWLSPIAFLRPSLDIPYCHHEKWDGTGYPRGLKGKEIPIAARLFAMVDVWDALTSDRPYREAWPEQKVLTHLQENSGSHFDPRVVEEFIQLISEERDKTQTTDQAAKAA